MQFKSQEYTNQPSMW